LDMGIVCLSIVGIVLEEMESGIINVNPTIIRVMRVLRIARGMQSCFSYTATFQLRIRVNLPFPPLPPLCPYPPFASPPPFPSLPSPFPPRREAAPLKPARGSGATPAGSGVELRPHSHFAAFYTCITHLVAAFLVLWSALQGVAK